MDKKKRDELKKLIINETEKLTPEQISQQIFESAKALTPEQQKDKNKERDKEIIHLTGGGTTSLKEIKDMRASARQPYKPHFQYAKPYYKNVYKLKRWPEEEYTQFRKRREVAEITIRLFYLRFPPEVLRHLRKENPFIFAYIRKYKYFQYLTKEGQDLLDSFIDDALMMMIGYDDWDRFEFDYW